MADEPFFPPPRERKDDEETAYRTPGERAEAPEEPRRAPIVAQRAEPPPEDGPAPGAKKPPMLTPDEVRSLLVTTEAASSPRALVRCAKRSVVFVPVGLVRTFASALLGDFATLVSLVLFAAALVWISLPLWRQTRDGWL